MQDILEQQDINSSELESLLRLREEGKVDFILVDVREDIEYNSSHIVGVDMLKPTSSFHEWAELLLEELKDEKIIFTCRTGNRSGQVQNIFMQQGHKIVSNHVGGIMSYRGSKEK